MNIRITFFALLAFTLLASVNVGAAVLKQTFSNNFQTNAIYLWSGDPSNMSLEGVAFGANMSGWKADVRTPAKLVLSGPTIDTAVGSFSLKMKYKNTPFQLEWAEVFFDTVNNVVRGYGTLTYNGSGWGNADVATRLRDIPLQATAAAMPVPSSVLLMLSALALVPLQRLRNRHAARA